VIIVKFLACGVVPGQIFAKELGVVVEVVSTHLAANKADGFHIFRNTLLDGKMHALLIKFITDQETSFIDYTVP
jgi:hypothetical protein